MTACNSEKKESKIQTKDALENIMGRKSVRKYLPKPVEKEKIEVLLKAGMAAPSGKDVRPWELIVIDDREVLDSMAAVLPYAKMLKEEIQKCKKLTDHPFGVNIMLLNPEAKEMAQIVIDEQVPIVTTGAGNPGIYMKMWKEAGIKVFPVVPSVALAKRLERAGADALIVEGCEAGGHIGEATTMALVPQVVENVSIPVIASGGAGTKEHFYDAFDQGKADAALAASLFHFKELEIMDLKRYLREKGISVRI